MKIVYLGDHPNSVEVARKFEANKHVFEKYAAKHNINKADVLVIFGESAEVITEFLTLLPYPHPPVIAVLEQEKIDPQAYATLLKRGVLCVLPLLTPEVLHLQAEALYKLRESLFVPKITYRGLSLDVTNGTLTDKKTGKKVSLTKGEVEFVYALISRAGQPVSLDERMKSANDEILSLRQKQSIRARVSYLRKKLSFAPRFEIQSLGRNAQYILREKAR